MLMTNHRVGVQTESARHLSRVKHGVSARQCLKRGYLDLAGGAKLNLCFGIYIMYVCVCVCVCI